MVQIPLPADKIKAFCKRWKITKLALFGSVLRDDFHSNSDVDIIVEFERNLRYGLFDLVVMEDELKAIFNRDVDLVTRKGIANSRNYLRRENILNSAKTIYESGKTISP
ncbi:nucleotidyltransferase family protein [Pleurocapsa sp. PCC 7319]|uniref:nucleotidyltransferase family protein n=1 Tax=Pleurocapsa sp. PCC 7319 TaxID=118161 RepID=UPI000346DC57|nr:nucleotidyltransferase family protein [Pleurocapsa sp. PCC 7319]